MADHAPISYQPTDGLSYDPSEPVYWDAEKLDAETRRAFEVCHGCRMCFKYCDSFPILFDLIDQRYDGKVTGLDQGDIHRVADACFQCKLCDVQCPYTPRDGHEFQLDFPKLIHRIQAVRYGGTGRGLRQRLLGDPDLAGSLARTSFGMANVMNRTRLHRWFMEKILGVHRDKLLPDFASSTFERWARQEKRLDHEAGGETVLFQTCYVQNNEPQIGRDTVEVLEKNGVDVRCTAGLQCCGMPAWEHGDLQRLRRQAKANLDILMPYVEAGAKVLAINPTCSMMMRREWAELLEGDDRERAAKLAEAVMDPAEYLWSIRKEDRFNTDFRTTPGGPVAYHAPCHLRAQAVGFKGRDLMRKIPGVKPQLVMECCGHDGTWSMTVDGFEASQKIGQKSFDGMNDAEAEIWATDCPLAALQFEQHAGRRAMHPMTVLARAYRDDGFPTKVEPPQES